MDEEKRFEEFYQGVPKPELGKVLHASTPGVLRQFKKDTRHSLFRRIWDFITQRKTILAHQIREEDELWVKVKYLGIQENKHSFVVI